MNYVSPSRGQTGAVDALLAGYAAGALSRPLHVLVAAHLALKADNRTFVTSLERLAAASMVERAEPRADGLATRRDRRLAAIFDLDPAEAEAEQGAAFLPEPLARYLGAPYEELAWRDVLPGVRQVDFDHEPGCEAALRWIKAGRAMPASPHGGLEATLVLKGSFMDATGCYARGDIAVADGDVDHRPVAGLDEDCICFAVGDGPVRLAGSVARLFQKLAGH